jgi:hypothetical protein
MLCAVHQFPHERFGMKSRCKNAALFEKFLSIAVAGDDS